MRVLLVSIALMSIGDAFGGPVVYECMTNSDCDLGYFCILGKCSRNPSIGGSNVSCTPGQKIDVDSGLCVECPGGAYCPGNCTYSGKGLLVILSSDAICRETVDMQGTMACPSDYPNSSAGATSINSCYANITRGCTQYDGAIHSGCASATEWNACSCAGGTYIKYYDGTIVGTTSNETCFKTPKTVTASAKHYVSGTTCPSCPINYPNSNGGYIDSGWCYTNITRGCTQNNGDTPSGCASVTEWNACSCAGGRYIKYYNGTTSGTTSNETCTKTPKTVTASANHYVSGTTCPACSSYSSTYTKSDGGSIGSGSCYTNITRGCTQNNGSTPSGCASVTAWNACSCAGTTYKKYASGSTSGTTSNETCTKTPKTVTANADHYVSGATCPACSSYSSSYPSSAGGNITSSSCYGSFSKSGSQLACSKPANSASYTCGSCTVGTCDYTKYASGTIKTDCTPTNCTKPVAFVSCEANYYASGVTCPACPTAYPYSDAGTTSDSYCYASKTNTGSQLSCSQPENSESYTCGTCTPGTCDWRDYKSATDTSCTPTDCNQPVNPGSVVCNTGYYTSGTTCPPCTGLPSNAEWRGSATSDDCPWKCIDGYNLTADGQCEQYCTAGVTHIHLGTGLKIPLYSVKRTTPSINVRHNGTVCYADLIEGESTGLHVRYNGKTYHAAE